ncbi:TIR domain-containing protein [Nodosilinea sp. LEGE 07298]|uniref:TIR domain-containing protein n=1 Tax=Nodosilinea sp. LEGE 07298 TaxID=2777970 RepID=UPI00187FA0E7|nr:TIR domain-containing protein [Nodosilinea sp. LEGE 07298]MBE9113970.1 TIR domain-containing protein [Nodosilinea sp. LEGE 07298]
MPSIFISYRRSDSQDVTERIYDRLVTHFGEEAVFRDAEGISPGEDFREFINRALDECKVLLVVIGLNWLNTTDTQGNRRLDNPNDWVRMEIEAALQREDLVVVPVLVGNASIPRIEDFPNGLEELAYFNGVNVRPDPDFHVDMKRLIGRLEQLLIGPTQQPPQPRNEPQSFRMQKILFLAANPTNPTRLRLDEELRDIEEGLRRAQHRDQFTLAQRRAVRPRDIQRAVLEETPQIVHFSGYGDGAEGLVFEDAGQAQRVSGETLAGLFALFTDSAEFSNPIHCVVLNGCYSAIQAEAIAEQVPYVVGMTQEIGDRAAIDFAVGFYDALGAGYSVEFAYKLGCAAIDLAGRPESFTPILINKKAPSPSPPESPLPYPRTPILQGRTELYQFLLQLPGLLDDTERGG